MLRKVWILIPAFFLSCMCNNFCGDAPVGSSTSQAYLHTASPCYACDVIDQHSLYGTCSCGTVMCQKCVCIYNGECAYCRAFSPSLVEQISVLSSDELIGVLIQQEEEAATAENTAGTTNENNQTEASHTQDGHECQACYAASVDDEVGFCVCGTAMCRTCVKDRQGECVHCQDVSPELVEQLFSFNTQELLDVLQQEVTPSNENGQAYTEYEQTEDGHTCPICFEEDKSYENMVTCPACKNAICVTCKENNDKPSSRSRGLCPFCRSRF